MKKILLLQIALFTAPLLFAQQTLTGTIWEYTDSEEQKPLAGATLQWLGTQSGTNTDLEGKYSLEKVSATNKLIVSYPAYQNDTITVEKDRTILDVFMSSPSMLDAVVVIARRSGAYVSVKPILTTVITTDGLRKAACCNLSESFDNTVAVDVEYADAVSGAKQISMLGLAGVYSQILLENTPYIRLLSNQFGLGFVPGTWMESISISKGIASVTNGYEAITGQINVEYKKPETNTEKLFLNLYGSTSGKGEFNLNSRFNVKENVSTMFLLHTEGQFAKLDMNHDNFRDLPQNYQVNAMNRWDYTVPGKFEGRTMVAYLWEDRIGGTMDYTPGKEFFSDSTWGLNIKTNKLDVITKNGFLLKGHHESIGTILSFNFHDNKSIFGHRTYDAQQLSGYANVLYSNRLGKKERSKITAGASFQIDHLKDHLYGDPREYIYTSPTERMEIVPGVFAEYSYSIDEKLVVMPGIRFDYNSLYDELFWTPRLHIKWMPFKNTSLRLSGGKGYRTSNVIVENTSLLISNREFRFLEDLTPEIAYNTGISLVQSFMMKGGKSSLSLDYYYTGFENQTVVDVDRDPHYVYIANLDGKSNSHSVQAELIMLPFKRFEVVVAYRYNRVWQTNTSGEYASKALMSPHKAVLNLNYSTKFDKWKFNATLQYNSSMRLPDTKDNPVEFRLGSQSPDYFILNAQVTKKFRKLEVYVGGENLLNYKQKNPILSANEPYSEYFDASIIYAPIHGAMGYVGMRWTLK
ncbi:TonB-dependent receptor [Bacteroidales bacterium OttesenSCG-928-B11]|nr:TonB-dependent receptor [Bacteroidales bacterium OttesenSCG-928-E04]MDL2312373.1 TonB-dependent receptor [Bacteroidales bacterium OttesenSCG-928-B11]